MSRQISPAGSRRSVGASGAPSRIPSGDGLRGSRSAPMLKGGVESSGLGMNHSMVLGTMAKGMGAKISSTLHHRGEHECGAIMDPNDNHVYVPRAQWTQSHDHPLKANNATWNQQHFVADELKRLHGEAKKKEYLRREVDNQLEERNQNRKRMVNEKEDFANLVNADTARYFQDQERAKAESKRGYEMMRNGLGQQQSDLSRRAHETRLREAQDQAEIKMRTVQQMCEELAEQERKKRSAQNDLNQGMLNNEKRRQQANADKGKDDEKVRRECREALMQDEYRLQATQERLKASQAQQGACLALYDRTAGQANRDRENAETTRVDNDEKKHLMRTDAYYGQREKARERQRQNMVNELDRQMQGINQRKARDRLAKEAERDAVQMATKRSLDQEMAKGMTKKIEERELQNELRIMMAEREEREAKEDGPTKPASLSTMHMVMRRNGNAANHMTGLQYKLDASRHTAKPLGREDKPGERSMVPLDASPRTLRRLAKPFAKETVPINTVLGGVVGTLGGGGGPINTALMATGGPYEPHLAKATGIAVQDRKLASHWHEGLSAEHHQAGRKEASRREKAKAEANRD